MTLRAKSSVPLARARGGEIMPDFSVLLQMMKEKNMDLSGLSQGDSELDMETMMKLAKLMSAMNSSQNNASTNLLYALKPFLRNSKQEKIDQYAQLLKMSSILEEMNKSGGEHQ